LLQCLASNKEQIQEARPSTSDITALAQSQAKPAVRKPSQARPFSQLQMAFGLAQDFIKPEPGALAAAFYVINLVL